MQRRLGSGDPVGKLVPAPVEDDASQGRLALRQQAGFRQPPELRGFNDEIFAGGKSFGDTLQLDPGDSAYVLSNERFCMPWDLAANLGVRFRFARIGLSVLTGLHGFGAVIAAIAGLLAIGLCIVAIVIATTKTFSAAFYAGDHKPAPEGE